MSPKRPRSHLNADLAIAKLQEAFVKQGWSAEVLEKDYGEDLLVRVFDEEAATPYTFYVQAKSSESLKKKGGKYVRYPIDFDHLQHWLEFWDPVFIMLWDRSTETVTWDMIQEPSLPIDTSGKRAKVLIPRANRLTPEGLRTIRNKTLARHKRFQREREGSEALVSTLASYVGGDIDYHPESGVLTLTHADDAIEFVLFGRLGEIAQLLAEERGVSIEDIVNIAIRELADIYESVKSGNPFEVEQDDGSVVQYRTIEELRSYLGRAWDE